MTRMLTCPLDLISHHAALTLGRGSDSEKALSTPIVGELEMEVRKGLCPESPPLDDELKQL